MRVVVHNHLHYAGKKLTNEFEDLALDSNFPLDQTVFKLCFTPLSVGTSKWPEENNSQLIQYSMKTKLSLEYVDYAFLGSHNFLKPTDMDVWVQCYRNQYDINIKVGYFDVACGPFFLHSLRQSTKIWKQVLKRLEEGTISEPDTFIPLCQTLVVNETGQMIRFGQASTDENTLLQPKHCSMYAWRSNKASQKLNVSIESKDWVWSKAFTLTKDGEQMVKMASNGSERKQVLKRLEEGTISEPDTFIPLCQTLVVNETGQMIRFGQASTDENTLLQPKHCSMYAWRSNKASQKLNVSIESKDWVWSKAFTLTKDGEQMVKMASNGSERNLPMMVHIDRKLSTFCIVKFYEMFNILNLLREHIELRIIPKSSKEIRCLTGSYCRPTSVVASCDGSIVKSDSLV